jgi:hypothetical protein
MVNWNDARLGAYDEARGMRCVWVRCDKSDDPREQPKPQPAVTKPKRKATKGSK